METGLSCFSWQPPSHPEGRAPCFSAVPLALSPRANGFVFRGTSTHCLSLEERRCEKEDEANALAKCDGASLEASFQMGGLQVAGVCLVPACLQTL